ncbi:MAG TPA: FAD-binding oxidoreductase [Candidatus Dormibacteraeota bacterium]|nr:FAD-binding oxidoreductase [Candidatus Dormibacteraeota bacterium]
MSADCVVVGGGVVGCSLAYHLAVGGLRPVLLERGELAGGSTARGAGGVRQQFSTAANVRVSMMSRTMLERFEDETGTDPDFRKIGYLFLATGDDEAALFARNVAVQRAAGLADVELLTVDRALEMVPELHSADLAAATWCPSDGLAGPNEVTVGYARAARRHGARVVEGAAVTGIDRDGDRVTGVRVGAASISTPLVVDCAGPFASAVGRMAGVDVPVTPYRRHIFLTEAFSLARRPPMVVDFRTSFYFHPEGDGLMLGMSDPAEPPGYDTSVSWDFLTHLIEHATHRLPVLAGAGIRTGWAGLYEVSPDHNAIVGPAPAVEGLWLCCGFSGHGFMQAPAIGHLLARRLLGVEPEIDLSPYAPDRFDSGRRWEAEVAVI